MRSTERTQVAEILDLTLRIIRLLTGEDYFFERKRGQRGAHADDSDVPVSRRMPVTEPLPPSPSRERHNEQKILKLTNKVTHLLTGEVWQYIEGQKDPHEIVTMETPISQADASPGKPKIDGFHTSPPQCSPGKESYLVWNLETCHSGTAEVPAQNTNCTVKDPEEPSSRGQRSPTDGQTDSITERTQTEYLPADYEEDSASFGEGSPTVMDVYPPIGHSQTEYVITQVKEELSSSEEGNLIDPDVSTPVAHIPTEYLPSYIKEDPALCLEGRLGSSSIYSLTGYKTTPIKAEPTSREGDNPTGTYIYTPSGPTRTENRLSTLEYDKEVTARERNRVLWVIKCGECGIDFNSKASYVAHIRTHAMGGFHVRLRPFSCTECYKCFTRKADLLRHLRTHTGEKPFYCSECGKSFTQKSSLIAHHRIHSGEKPFTCPECSRRFTQKSYLIIHRRTHTGEKPFRCGECGKSFNSKEEVVRHHRTHTGDKPFGCAECGKRFALRSNLINHQRSHTGEKPFSCTECDKRFTRKSTLVRHRRTHTRDKPFSCSECGKRFPHKAGQRPDQGVQRGQRPLACSSCWKPNA